MTLNSGSVQWKRKWRKDKWRENKTFSLKNFWMALHGWNCCCCCWVAQLYLTLFDPVDCSTPGFTVLHYLRSCSNSCPLSQWCHPIISSSVTPFSSCPQSSQASGSFPVSQPFESCGQKYWSFSTNPSNEYSGLISFRTDWFDLLGYE